MIDLERGICLSISIYVYLSNSNSFILRVYICMRLLSDLYVVICR